METLIDLLAPLVGKFGVYIAAAAGGLIALGAAYFKGRSAQKAAQDRARLKDMRTAKEVEREIAAQSAEQHGKELEKWER